MADRNQYDKIDLILFANIGRARAIWLDEAPEHTFSEPFLTKTASLLRRQHPKRLVRALRAAVAAALIAAGLLTVGVATDNPLSRSIIDSLSSLSYRLINGEYDAQQILMIGNLIERGDQTLGVYLLDRRFHDVLTDELVEIDLENVETRMRSEWGAMDLSAVRIAFDHADQLWWAAYLPKGMTVVSPDGELLLEWWSGELTDRTSGEDDVTFPHARIWDMRVDDAYIYLLTVQENSGNMPDRVSDLWIMDYQGVLLLHRNAWEIDIDGNGQVFYIDGTRSSLCCVDVSTGELKSKAMGNYERKLQELCYSSMTRQVYFFDECDLYVAPSHALDQAVRLSSKSALLQNPAVWDQRSGTDVIIYVKRADKLVKYRPIPN